MIMKLLDWKSFAIGVLLTTTIVLRNRCFKRTNCGFIEKTRTIIPWDANQQWEYKTSNTKNIPKGWEPFAYDSNDNFDPLLVTASHQIISREKRNPTHSVTLAP